MLLGCAVMKVSKWISDFRPRVLIESDLILSWRLLLLGGVSGAWVLGVLSGYGPARPVSDMGPMTHFMFSCGQ